jgi:glycosyltransferase involved in cell wall biosynthesis/peptidoglycan/xylan/chitin deacetylase (PgdA/CDA1 family)
MTSPLISVVIPVRNYEEYITASIESVLAQEFKEWELIIVDDYSTDRTNEIAARYQDGEKVRLVRNERNLGQFPTHNRGAELARGKYLKFFHGDDVMYRHCLGTMVSCMEAFPHAALGISAPRRLWPAPHLFSPAEVWRAQTDRLTSILTEGPSGTIFQAEAFRQAGGFGSRFHTSDGEMNHRIALEHSILLLPDGLWWYRIHEGQVSQTVARGDVGAAETLVWFRELLADPRNPLTLLERAEVDRQMIRNHWRLILRRLSEGKIDPGLRLWRSSGLPLHCLPLALSRSRDATSPKRLFPGRLLMKLRRAAFSGLYQAGGFRVFLKPSSGSIRYCVLAYHGISEKPQPLFTSRRLFESHLRCFARWGGVATMDELARFLLGESVPDGPKLRFVITFDDGYANVIRNAAPLLRQYNQRGIVFVNPAWIEKSLVPWCFWMAGRESPAPEMRRSLAGAGFGKYKSLADAEADLWPTRLIDDIAEKVGQETFSEWWSEVAAGFPPPTQALQLEAKTAAWEELTSARDILDVGSHTYSHSILGLCRDPEFIRSEVVRSKAAIEERLGRPCAHFAYPRGLPTDFSEKLHKLVAEAGHRTAATACGGLVVAGTNQYEIPRYYVSETPVAELAAELSGVMESWDRNVSKLKALVRS